METKRKEAKGEGTKRKEAKGEGTKRKEAKGEGTKREETIRKLRRAAACCLTS